MLLCGMQLYKTSPSDYQISTDPTSRTPGFALGLDVKNKREAEEQLVYIRLRFFELHRKTSCLYSIQSS